LVPPIFVRYAGEYTLQDADEGELSMWAGRLLARLRELKELTDVASVVVDREKASRLNILPQAIDDTLYDAFGQRQVSIIFTQLLIICFLAPPIFVRYAGEEELLFQAHRTWPDPYQMQAAVSTGGSCVFSAFLPTAEVKTRDAGGRAGRLGRGAGGQRSSPGRACLSPRMAQVRLAQSVSTFS
jgi:hypothetical protein